MVALEASTCIFGWCFETGSAMIVTLDMESRLEFSHVKDFSRGLLHVIFLSFSKKGLMTCCDSHQNLWRCKTKPSIICNIF
jgi:hypothetical protein